MPFISLYFATIVGARTMTTLPDDFQLADMLRVIRNEINATADENCIFMCKGKRLSLDDPVIFQDQKKKLIRDGDVILVGNKITDNYWNQLQGRSHESESFIQICLVAANGQQKICKILENFDLVNLVQLFEHEFGLLALKNSRFTCMGEELILTDNFMFKRQKKLIRNGSIIFETLRNKANIPQEQDFIVTESNYNIQNFYFLFSIIFLLISYFYHM